MNEVGDNDLIRTRPKKRTPQNPKEIEIEIGRITSTVQSSPVQEGAMLSIAQLGSASAAASTRDFPSLASHSNIARLSPRHPLQRLYRSRRPGQASAQTYQGATAEAPSGSCPSTTPRANEQGIIKTRGWPRA
jgi:hypothetical protein